MNAKQWITILTTAIEVAFRTAKDAGVELPAHDQVDDILAAVNKAAAAALPAVALGAAVAVTSGAATIGKKIASLGETERCHQCGGVLTIYAEKDVHTGAVSRRTACSNCDGPK